MQTEVYRLNAPQVACQAIDGETILINFESGAYYSAGRTGGAVVAWLDAGHAGSDIIAHLEATAGADPGAIESSVRAFVDELVREGLLVPHPAPGVGLTPMQPLDAAFEAPQLQKFDDLQDILLLDPIHDGDHPAWPVEQSGGKPGEG